MLIEETTVPDAALPVDEFKAHLRQGTGFGEDTLQDEVLRSFLRASIAAIEARTGKVLMERAFSWTLSAFGVIGQGQSSARGPRRGNHCGDMVTVVRRSWTVATMRIGWKPTAAPAVACTGLRCRWCRQGGQWS